MNIKDYIEEKQKVFKQLDSAIDKTFSNDAEERKEGREELEKFRGKDEAVPFAIGYAHQIEYDCTGNPENAQKAIEEYKRIVNEGYAFLKESIQELEARLGN